jgi:hypothetical protein
MPIEIKSDNSVELVGLGERFTWANPTNAAAIKYWEMTGYTHEEVIRVATELNNDWMFAVVRHLGDGKIDFSVSKKTWERQEGHYPNMMRFWSAVAQHAKVSAFKGTVMLWLEDGMWESVQMFARRIPIFAFGRQVTDRQTLLIPDPAYIGGAAYLKEREDYKNITREIPWHKRMPTIFWRGAASGCGIEGGQWTDTPRGRLVQKAVELSNPRMLDAKLTKVAHIPLEQQRNFYERGFLAEEVPFENFLHYRFMLDADGYSCAWMSFFLKLISGSVVLKMDSPIEQWYYRELVPWKHYIPVAKDLSDLEHVYTWLITHDEQARQIAIEGDRAARQLVLERSLAQVIGDLEAVVTCLRER